MSATIRNVAGGNAGGKSRYRRYRESPRAQRRALWIGLAVFVVGAAAVPFALFRNTAHPLKDVASNEPAQIAAKPSTVALDPNALKIAREFILTAVARKNLDAAYDITDTDVRGTMTRRQWESGTIPVEYYPVGDVPLDAFKVTYSYPHQALLQVSLVSKKGQTSENKEGFTFFIGLKKVGSGGQDRWVVNYWAPDYHPPIPGGPQ